MSWVRHTGGCHCGKVRFEVLAPAKPEVLDCNCSICSKTGFLHLIVSKESFKLISGEGAMSEYQFNKHNIHHLFCATCGIQSFARGKRPDGAEMMVAVNARCLDGVEPDSLKVKKVDGRKF